MLSHKTVFLKTPLVKMEIYSNAVMAHQASLDMYVLRALSFCLGPILNLLGTFMSLTPETWGMNVGIVHFMASQLFLTDVAAEAHLSRTLTVLLSLKSSIKWCISRYPSNAYQTPTINCLREEVLQFRQKKRHPQGFPSCMGAATAGMEIISLRPFDYKKNSQLIFFYFSILCKYYKLKVLTF